MQNIKKYEALIKIEYKDLNVKELSFLLNYLNSLIEMPYINNYKTSGIKFNLEGPEYDAVKRYYSSIKTNETYYEGTKIEGTKIEGTKIEITYKYIKKTILRYIRIKQRHTKQNKGKIFDTENSTIILKRLSNLLIKESEYEALGKSLLEQKLANIITDIGNILYNTNNRKGNEIDLIHILNEIDLIHILNESKLEIYKYLNIQNYNTYIILYESIDKLIKKTSKLEEKTIFKLLKLIIILKDEYILLRNTKQFRIFLGAYNKSNICKNSLYKNDLNIKYIEKGSLWLLLTFSKYILKFVCFLKDEYKKGLYGNIYKATKDIKLLNKVKKILDIQDIDIQDKIIKKMLYMDCLYNNNNKIEQFRCCTEKFTKDEIINTAIHEFIDTPINILFAIISSFGRFSFIISKEDVVKYINKK